MRRMIPKIKIGGSYGPWHLWTLAAYGKGWEYQGIKEDPEDILDVVRTSLPVRTGEAETASYAAFYVMNA